MTSIVVCLISVLCQLPHSGLESRKTPQPFRIQVVEQSSNWPVPLVQIETTHHLKWVTDNAGVVAIGSPELLGNETWFSIKSDGYEFASDGFGYSGIRLTPKAGESVTVQVKRTSLARRLGRLTGAGLFAESQQVGEFSDWQEQKITGCDSVRVAQHEGKLFWVWGDTSLLHYPLGLFHTLAARTDMEPLQKYEPPLELRFEYVTDKQQIPRDAAEMPGRGPSWLDGLVSLKDENGRSRLVATFAKVKKPMIVYRLGLCEWDRELQRFRHVKNTWELTDETPTPGLQPMGHVSRWADAEGRKWLLFGDPFPKLKCPDSYEAWSDPEQWKEVESPRKVKALGGQQITVHRGSIAWFESRQKWSCIFGQLNGDRSVLGEIWYTESDSPFGPWRPAVKVLSHNKYSFYNPKIQQELAPENAPFLLFEGTYTQTFSKASVPTPRYNYNQILYRVDFSELDQAFSKSVGD